MPQLLSVLLVLANIVLLYLYRAVITVMHVDMFNMVLSVKQNALSLHTPTLLKYVVPVIPTASVAVRGQQTDLVLVVAMPVTS